MRRDDAIRVLRGQESEVRRAGVRSLYLFGSTARDEARADSDVDLFIDYDPNRFGLIELARLRRELSAVLTRPADLATRDGLHPLLRESIEREALRVF